MTSFRRTRPKPLIKCSFKSLPIFSFAQNSQNVFCYFTYVLAISTRTYRRYLLKQMYISYQRIPFSDLTIMETPKCLSLFAHLPRRHHARNNDLKQQQVQSFTKRTTTFHVQCRNRLALWVLLLYITTDMYWSCQTYNDPLTVTCITFVSNSQYLL